MLATFENYKKLLIAIVHNYLPNAKIYLYGSRARGTHKLESDIDIALDVGQKISLSVLGSIREEIEESAIPLFVDIVDLHGALSEDFKKEVERDGVAWN